MPNKISLSELYLLKHVAKLQNMISNFILISLSETVVIFGLKLLRGLVLRYEIT